MYDLSLNFYKVTKETDINSLKNKNNHGLIRIAQALININEEAMVIEIGIPKILSDENKKIIENIIQLFEAESIIKGVDNYVLFVDDYNMCVYNEEHRINLLSFINKCGLEFVIDKNKLIAIYQNEIGKNISWDILYKR